MSRTIYRAGTTTWQHPTEPDIIPGSVIPDPPPPGDPDGMWFGTTLFGAAYSNYKKHRIGSVQNRYNQCEYDTVYGGNRGNAVVRIFNTGAIGTWSNMMSEARGGQAICFSFKDGGGVNNSTETEFKNAFKAWMDGRPGGSSTYVWLSFHHEWDNENGTTLTNGNNRTGEMLNWYNRHIWLREVLEETAYRANAAKNGGWLKLGPIATGVPFQKSTLPTDPKGYRTYTNGILDVSGRTNATDIWDFWGTDRYNPAWEGNTRYMSWANWSVRMVQLHQEYNMPFVIGEAGSARATQTLGQTLAQRNAERAAWLNTQWGNIKAAGWFDACMYWRTPANSNAVNAWSTNLVVPGTDYDDWLTSSDYVYTDPDTGTQYPWNAPSDAKSNGGFEDQPTSDVISEYCVRSITEANALGIGPTLTYYTGSGGYG